MQEEVGPLVQEGFKGWNSCARAALGGHSEKVVSQNLKFVVKFFSDITVACRYFSLTHHLPLVRFGEEVRKRELGLDDFQKKNRLSIVVFCGTNSLVSTLALILIGFWEFGWKRMFMFGLFLAAELLMIEMVNDFWLFFLPFANLRIGLYFIPWEEKKEIEESVETKPDHDQPPARHSCHKAVYQLRHPV